MSDGPVEHAKAYYKRPPLKTPVITKGLTQDLLFQGGFLRKRHHKNRRQGLPGFFIGYVPGTQKQFWWVQHPHGVAYYHKDELTDYVI